jgi:hypothetical protein
MSDSDYSTYSSTRYVYDERPPFIILEHTFITEIMQEIGPSATCVYLYLLKCAGSFQSCYPSATNIAENTGISERTVRDCIKILKESSLVAVQPRMRLGGGQTSNILQILPYVRPANIADRALQNLHPKKIKNEKDVDIYPANKKRQKRSIDYHQDFEQFWSRTWKVGSKEKAFKSWDALSDSDMRDVLECVDEWTVYYTQDGVWQKHVVTWLNERLWETAIPRVINKNGHKPLLADREWIKA